MKKAFIILIGLFACVINQVYAQGNVIITPSIQYGTVIKTDDIFPTAEHSPYIIGLNVSKQTTGKALWQQLYHYPQLGIIAYRVNAGNNDVLGNGYVIAPNLIFQLNHNKRFPIEVGLYSGYGYLQKEYDIVKDPLNNVIGTHFNFFDEASLSFNPRLCKSLNLTVGVSVSHLSNGRLKDPDLGINIPAVFLALRFNYKTDSVNKIHQDIPKVNKKLYVSVRAGIGAHDYGVKGGPIYYLYTGMLSINKRITPVFKLGLGAHFSYNSSTYYFLINQEIAPANKAPGISSRFAFPVANAEWFVGHLALNVEVGPYWNHPFLTDGIAYAMFGFQYYIQQTYKNLHHHEFIGMMVQATTGRAEFPEICVGYCF